jgi:hypothetical protein
MLKKNIILITFIFMLLMGFSVFSYAAPNNNEEDFFTIFNIQKDELKDFVVSTTSSDINNYKVFTFNKGFVKSKFSTFASSKNVLGEGEEGTSVGIVVYKVVDGKVTITFESAKVLGVSGLYNETIEFKDIGTSNLLLAIKKGNYIKYKVLEVSRKKQETKNQLENIEINFMPKQEVKKEQNNELENLIDSISSFDFTKYNEETEDKNNMSYE